MENTQPTSPHPTDPHIDSILPKPPPVKRNWWITSTVIFALLFIFMTYQHYTYRANYNVAKTLENTFNEKTTPTASPTPDPTANWKTYTNQKYKYSLDYPEEWVVEEGTESNIANVRLSPEVDECPSGINPFTCVYAEIIDIYVEDNPENLSIENFLNKNKKLPNTISFQPIVINGIEGRRTTSIPGQFENDDIFIKNGSQIINIRLIHNLMEKRISKELFDQILQTFKFSNQDAAISPTCIPRPACLDSEPRCMIPETSDMCPPVNN